MKFFTVPHGVLGSPSPEDLAIVLLNGFRSFPTYYTSQIVRPPFHLVARAGLEHAYREALAQAYDAWRLSP